MAMLRHGSDTPGRLSAFASLTESQFFNPLATITDTKRLHVEALDGSSLSVVRDVPTFALPSDGVEAEGPSCVVRSIEFRIQIPLLAPIAGSHLAGSGLRVTVSDRRTSWEGHLQLADDGNAWAVGHLERAVGKAPFALPLKAMTLAITRARW